MVRAPRCGRGGCRFESGRAPQTGVLNGGISIMFNLANLVLYTLPLVGIALIMCLVGINL